MRFVYREWDGTEFPTQDHLSQFDHFLDYLMDYGQQAMEALRQLELDPEQAELLEKWIEEGLLERSGARFRLTPRAINSMQRKALMEIFRDLKPGAVEGHETTLRGPRVSVERWSEIQRTPPIWRVPVSSCWKRSMSTTG